MMTFENIDQTPLREWLVKSGLMWLLVVALLLAVIYIVSWIVETIRVALRAETVMRPFYERDENATMAAVKGLLWIVVLGFINPLIAGFRLVCDWVFLSPRRVGAIAMLSFREALRRKIVVVFIIFVVFILFAGWFLDKNSHAPARLYINFVLWMTSILVLLLAVFLSATSIPEDIKNRTIFTVATKPVRVSEMILGRIIGFSAVGTILLGALAIISYGFVVRGVSHEHVLEPTQLADLEHRIAEQIKKGNAESIVLKTNLVQNHRHAVRIDLSKNKLISGSQTRDATFEELGQILRGEMGEGFDHIAIDVDRTDPAQNHWHQMILRVDRIKALVDASDSADARISGGLAGSGSAGDDATGNDSEDGLSPAGETLAETALPEGLADDEFTDEDASGVRINASLQFGASEGRLIARVPMWGKVNFLDKNGNLKDQGVNVGDEWEYRSFIQGGTQAAGIWSFPGVTANKFPRNKFPDGLPLELNFEVFRTHKGDTSDEDTIPAIPAQLSVRRWIRDSQGKVANKGEWVQVTIFPAREFSTDEQIIPWTIPTTDGEELDLMTDCVNNGVLTLKIRCVPRAQYFGFAERDVYLHASDAPFFMNMLKAFYGIWLRLVIVVTVGVMFSTFLSTAVALLATGATIIGGLCTKFMTELSQHQQYGGGPIEASIRLVNQSNVVTELDPTTTNMVAQGVDTVLENLLGVAATLIPDLGMFNFASFVSYGFDISGDGLLIKATVYTLAFIVPMVLLSHLFLKNREVAR